MSKGLWKINVTLPSSKLNGKNNEEVRANRYRLVIFIDWSIALRSQSNALRS